MSFQVGANANQTINLTSIRDARASALGSHTLETAGTAMNTVIVDTTAKTTAHGNGITVEANLALTTDKDTVSNISYTVNSDAVDMLFQLQIEAVII